MTKVNKVCIIALGVGRVDGVYVGGHVNNILNILDATKDIENTEFHVLTSPPVHSNLGVPEYFENGVHFHIINNPGYYELSIWFKITLFFRLLFSFINLNNSIKFNLVNTHSGFISFIFLIPFMRLFSNAKFIHTLYCPLKNDLVVLNILYRFISLFVDAYIAISKNIEASLMTLVPVEKIGMLYPIIDSRYYVESNYVRSDIHQILYVGNQKPSKGLDYLISEFKKIVQINPSLHLNICIDVLESELEVKAKDLITSIKYNGLIDNVSVLGIVSDLPSLMRRCTFFVCPFVDTQGPADIPVSLIEATSAGLITIASDVGGISEYISHNSNGLLINPLEENAVVKSVLSIMSNDESLAAMKKNAVSSAKQYNTKSKQAIIHYYSETIGP